MPRQGKRLARLFFRSPFWALSPARHHLDEEKELEAHDKPFRSTITRSAQNCAVTNTMVAAAAAAEEAHRNGYGAIPKGQRKARTEYGAARGKPAAT